MKSGGTAYGSLSISGGTALTMWERSGACKSLLLLWSLRDYRSSGLVSVVVLLADLLAEF